MELLREWTAHEGWIEALSFSADGGTLASASSDSIVRLWRVGG